MVKKKLTSGEIMFFSIQFFLLYFNVSLCFFVFKQVDLYQTKIATNFTALTDDLVFWAQ